MGFDWRFFAETALPFELPSLPYPAYPEASGMPVVRGPEARFFFDSAETT